METTTTGRPANPATSAFMRESRDAAGAPTSTRVTKHQRVTNHNFQTTSKPYPRVSLNFNNHDFPRRAVETIDEGKLGNRPGFEWNSVLKFIIPSLVGDLL